MGEDPQGIPNNLMPYITQVAIGRRDCLNIFGNDYPTKDGTCVRDYIHVMDLAEGHVKAWQVCGEKAGLHIYNLGAGQGVSVLEMVHAFARASGMEINYKLVDRRPGDVAECWADPAKAQRELGWKATRTLDDMTRDSWLWQQTNPNGYEA
jgi:UDP-glucose 4-epimerase